PGSAARARKSLSLSLGRGERGRINGRESFWGSTYRLRIATVASTAKKTTPDPLSTPYLPPVRRWRPTSGRLPGGGYRDRHLCGAPGHGVPGQASLRGGTGVGTSTTRVVSARSLDRLILVILMGMKGSSLGPRCENPEDSAAHPKTRFRSADTAIGSGE